MMIDYEAPSLGLQLRGESDQTSYLASNMKPYDPKYEFVMVKF